MAMARSVWKAHQGLLDPTRLVFIDETGTSTNMARLRGRCRRGQRLIGKVPHGHWKITTFVAALRHDAITAPFVIDEPMTGEIFRVYLKRCLVPTLKPGDTVVMDNLSAHKNDEVRSIIEAAGAQLRYLPPYSPDLNPIEMAFAKLTCARPPNARSPHSGTGSDQSSISSLRTNAQTSSITPVMRDLNPKWL